jgi:hypothetical protein
MMIAQSTSKPCYALMRQLSSAQYLTEFHLQILRGVLGHYHKTVKMLLSVQSRLTLRAICRAECEKTRVTKTGAIAIHCKLFILQPMREGWVFYGLQKV